MPTSNMTLSNRLKAPSIKKDKDAHFLPHLLNLEGLTKAIKQEKK